MASRDVGLIRSKAAEGVHMQLDVDPGQSVQQVAGPPELSHPWILGLIAVDDRQRAKPAMPPYSYRSECECPDACLRDHENE